MPADIMIDAVRDTKLALNRLGYYTPDAGGMTNDPNYAAFKDALHAFRRIMTIPFDEAEIGPASLTDRLLQQELKKTDDSALYVWRTVGDEKVRGDHAARNGQICSWNNPPDGENPGEDYNCRCWAELVVPRWNTWSDWLEERRAARNTLQFLSPAKGVNVELINELPEEKTNFVTPILTLFAAFLLLRLRKLSLPALRVFLRKDSKNAYEIALEGGKHAIFLKKYKNVSNKELEKGIRSFNKQIDRRLEKIQNPEKEYSDFKNLDKRRQKALLEKKWPSDIKRLEEQKEILRRILNERN